MEGMEMKKLLLRPPAFTDLLHLLAAWRVWIAGAFLGAVLATVVYLLAPPPYRAQATVLVDQNVEAVIPREQTDLRKYTYLQRETDKLVEIAWSDQTLARVSAQTGTPVAALRADRLHLSQPGDGGWHFLADASEPVSASTLASAWAGAFVEQLRSKPAGVSALLEINFTQQQDLPIRRAVSLSQYVFSGALLGIALLALILLFFERKTT
jgi:uncharacterized protein involved in exopolysaccharide biosynthesis